MDALKLISDGCLKADAPKVEVGDTVRVQVRIKEGEKSRLQAFEGTVIAKKHGGINETFTVRRMSHGVGVERVSLCIPPTWTRWNSSARAGCAAASSTTSVTVSARPPRSRKPSAKTEQRARERGQGAVPFCLRSNS